MRGLSATALGEISPEAKLVCGLIGKPEDLPMAERLLENLFGSIDARSEVLDFSFTDYYEKEIGAPLVRKWVSFDREFTQAEIVRVKLKTIGLERDLSRSDGTRRVNLDPGYVTGSRLVLASTKDFAHRVYLWGGIFAEVTLLFEHGSFVPLKWTYPDYRTELAVAYFNCAREMFLKSRRERTS